MDDARDFEFDPLHRVATTSAAYRSAIRACAPDLPEWLVPASVLDLSDLERIVEALSLSPGAALVDLGCGAGGSAIWVAEQARAALVGVDRSSVALRAAEQLATARGLSTSTRFIAADVTATGLPDACADGVMSVDTLMFVDPYGGVAEIARLLRPGRAACVRTVESLVEPFIPTLVKSYRPLFESCGLAVTHHEAPGSYDERSLAFFRAILDRADAIRAEAGEAASVLIDEAAESLERAKMAPRVRTVFIRAVRR